MLLPVGENLKERGVISDGDRTVGCVLNRLVVRQVVVDGMFLLGVPAEPDGWEEDLKSESLPDVEDVGEGLVLNGLAIVVVDSVDFHPEPGVDLQTSGDGGENEEPQRSHEHAEEVELPELVLQLDGVISRCDGVVRHKVYVELEEVLQMDTEGFVELCVEVHGPGEEQEGECCQYNSHCKSSIFIRFIF